MMLGQRGWEVEQHYTNTGSTSCVLGDTSVCRQSSISWDLSSAVVLMNYTTMRCEDIKVARAME